MRYCLVFFTSKLTTSAEVSVPVPAPAVPDSTSVPAPVDAPFGYAYQYGGLRVPRLGPPPPSPPPFVYVEPATELTPDQIKFNNMVEENKPIAEKETALLVWLKEHPDFNACYVDKDGYTPLFLCNKYQLSKVGYRLVHAYKAQFVYLKDGRCQDYALHKEEGVKLLQGIIERNDFEAFKAVFKLWELKLWRSRFYVCCGDRLEAYRMRLDVLAYMAKCNRQAMIATVLEKDPTAIKEEVPIDTGGRGYPSMLIEAARAGHKDLVVYLLAQGVNRDYETLIGETALSVAQQNGREEIVALLNPPMLTASI